MLLSKYLLLPISLLALMSCGGGGGGDEKCNYSPQDLKSLSIELEITEPSEKAPPAGTKIHIWRPDPFSSSNELKGKRTTSGTIYNFTDGNWSYSTNSKKTTASLWLKNSSGEETYTLTPTSPTTGTWVSTSYPISESKGYVSKGVFEYPSTISACQTLDESSKYVSTFDKTLSDEQKASITNGRTATSWPLLPSLSESGTYVFKNDTGDTVIGTLNNSSNEVTVSDSDIKAISSTFYGRHFDVNSVQGITSFEAADQYFYDNFLQVNPEGGWVYRSPDATLYSIDATGAVQSLNVPTKYSREHGSPLSTGNFAVYPINTTAPYYFTMLDSDFNQTCQGLDRPFTSDKAIFVGTSAGPSGNGGSLNPAVHNFIEDSNGNVYMGVLDTNDNKIYFTKWNTDCELIWEVSQSIIIAQLYPNLTIFKVVGDSLYFGFEDKLINLVGYGNSSGLARYTFARINLDTGVKEIISQKETPYLQFLSYIYDVAQDASGDLILAHGDTIEKINGTTFKSIISYGLNGYQPLVPINFDGNGNLEVNNKFVLDKKLFEVN